MGSSRANQYVEIHSDMMFIVPDTWAWGMAAQRTSSRSTGGPALLPWTRCSRSVNRFSCVSYWPGCTEKMGSDWKGWPANWHRIQLAAATPNAAGAAPSTGMVLTLKFGNYLRTKAQNSFSACYRMLISQEDAPFDVSARRCCKPNCHQQCALHVCGCRFKFCRTRPQQ